mgnify:CR=1 FL=1
MKRYELNKFNTIKLFDKNGYIIGSILVLKDGLYFDYERMGTSIHFSFDSGNSNTIMFPYKIQVFRTVCDESCYEIEVNEEVKANGN